jgi:hypothetical protein
MTARGYVWTLILLLALGGGYYVEQDRVNAFFDPELRGIGAASPVQLRAISTRLHQGMRIQDAYTLRSDVHEDASLVAARLYGKHYNGSIGLWVLEGPRRGPTSLTSANDAARNTSRVGYERTNSTGGQRLMRYVQKQ